MHIVEIAAEITALLPADVRPAHGVEGVVVSGIVGMVPVDQGIIQPHTKPLGAEGVDVFPHQVAPGGGVCGFVIGIGGIKQAKSFVMLCCEHGVFHTCLSGQARPCARIVINGVECAEIFFVALGRDAADAGIPFPLGGNGVKPPVDEHAETCVAKPLYVSHSERPPPADETAAGARPPPPLRCGHSCGTLCIRCGSVRRPRRGRRPQPA